jgi:hypothetical protein
VITFKQFVLNEGWLDNVQSGLSLGGLIPAVGIPIDLINAGISVARGKKTDAALNAIAAIPLAGYAANAVKAGRFAKGATKLGVGATQETLTRFNTAHVKKTTNDIINSITKVSPQTPSAVRQTYIDKALGLFKSGKLNGPLLATIALGAIGAGVLMSSREDDDDDQ